MKAMHEFSRQGSWRSAWPLTHMVDPYDMDGHGGDDVEMEVVMSWLRTKDDLRAKVSGTARVADAVSEDEGGDDDGEHRAPRPKPKPKPKAKRPPGADGG